mgnify:CR=1 FL=1
MLSLDPNGRAELVESIHQPWRATLGECLQRWRSLDVRTQGISYLVVDQGGGCRRTLNASKIAELAAVVG